VYKVRHVSSKISILWAGKRIRLRSATASLSSTHLELTYQQPLTTAPTTEHNLAQDLFEALAVAVKQLMGWTIKIFFSETPVTAVENKDRRVPADLMMLSRRDKERGQGLAKRETTPSDHFRVSPRRTLLLKLKYRQISSRRFMGIIWKDTFLDADVKPESHCCVVAMRAPNRFHIVNVKDAFPRWNVGVDRV
jgi:hypothetical protein